MKKLIAKTALLLVTTLALPMSAYAVEWTWSWTGSEATCPSVCNAGSGTLTTNDLLSGTYLITAMTGTWNTANITGLLPVGTQVVPGFPSDNLLSEFPPQQLTDKGLSFETSTRERVNLYHQGSYFAYSSGTSFDDPGFFTATQVAAVPEPGTYALMLAGLGLAGVAAKRRKAK